MDNTKKHFLDILSQIEAEGLYKRERTITTPQGVDISTVEGDLEDVFINLTKS